MAPTLQELTFDETHFSSIGGNGYFDRRKAGDVYVAEIPFNTSAGHPANVLPTTLDLWLKLNESVAAEKTIAANLGLTLATNDIAYVPLRISHGRRTDRDEGQFFILVQYDDDGAANGQLNMFLCFQGLAGDGDGTRTTIPRLLLSAKEDPSGDAGEMIDVDIHGMTLILVYETNDSTGTPQAPTAGGAGEFGDPT